MKPLKEENKKKTPKDPKAPVKPPSAFFIFLREQQKQVRKDLEYEKDTGISNNIVAKECGRRWQLLDAAAKQKYFEEQKKNQQVYNEELEAYNNSPEKLAESKINKILNKAKDSEQHIPQMFKDYFSFLESNWTKVAQGMAFASPYEIQETVWKIWSGSRTVAKDKEEESPLVIASRKRVYDEEDSNMDGVVHQDSEHSGTAIKEEATTSKSAFEFFIDAIRMETHKSGTNVPDDEIERLCGERWIYMNEKEKKAFYDLEIKDMNSRKLEGKSSGNKKKSRKRRANFPAQEPMTTVFVKEEIPDVSSSSNVINNNNIGIKKEFPSARGSGVTSDGIKLRVGIDSNLGATSRSSQQKDEDSDSENNLKINEDTSSNSSSSDSDSE